MRSRFRPSFIGADSQSPPEVERDSELSKRVRSVARGQTVRFVDQKVTETLSPKPCSDPGEYGFALAYQEKADMLRPWLEDRNEQVDSIATREIHRFEQEFAQENRRASEQVAMRRLDYREPLVDQEPPDDVE